MENLETAKVVILRNCKTAISQKKCKNKKNREIEKLRYQKIGKSRNEKSKNRESE